MPGNLLLKLPPLDGPSWVEEDVVYLQSPGRCSTVAIAQAIGAFGQCTNEAVYYNNQFTLPGRSWAGTTGAVVTSRPT